MNNQEVYDSILKDISEKGSLVGNTTELLNAHYDFDPYGLPLEQAKKGYTLHELQWYLSQDKNINGHEGIRNNGVWKSCATPEGFVNSNYGWCVYSDENYNQFGHALEALLSDKNTRQSICIYTRPAIQLEHNDGVHANHDMLCTFCTQHFIRDNKLEYIVNMRSNDVKFGLPYDLEWHKYVYNDLFRNLKGSYFDLEVGRIYWNAGSLHKYESVSE